MSRLTVPRPVSRAGARRSAGAGLALAATALALVPPAAQAADPVVLDAASPRDVAAYGNTLAWLRPDGPDRTQLVVRDPSGAVRVVDQRLPARVNDLTIGLDRPGGVATAVVATVSTEAGLPVAPRPARRGALYRLPLDGSAAPKRVAVSKPGADLAAPGLLRGRLTFAQRERLAEGTRWTVHTGTLGSGRARRVSRGTVDTRIVSTTPAAKGRLAYVTTTRNRETTGAALALRLLRPGHRSSVVSRTSYGGASESGFGPLTVSSEGGRLTASRWTIAGSHVHDLTTWALPSRRVVDTEKWSPASQKVVPVADGGDPRAFLATFGGPGEKGGVQPLLLQPGA
jgi:hypothetical protein